MQPELCRREGVGKEGESGSVGWNFSDREHTVAKGRGLELQLQRLRPHPCSCRPPQKLELDRGDIQESAQCQVGHSRARWAGSFPPKPLNRAGR